MSYNFEVKDTPIYHIVKAKTQKKQNNLQEALKTLTVAMNLPGMKRACMYIQISFVCCVANKSKLLLLWSCIQRCYRLTFVFSIVTD